MKLSDINFDFGQSNNNEEKFSDEFFSHEEKECQE
jgi:hypothetical protein